MTGPAKTVLTGRTKALARAVAVTGAIAVAPSGAGAATVPTVASNAALVALSVIADGIALYEFLGSTALDQNAGDDHPLYRTDTVAPSITVIATETYFNLFIKQTNPVTESVDDSAVQVKGIAKIPGANTAGEDAWRFDITFTADIETILPIPAANLSASGVVQHVRRVTGHANEATEGAALNFDQLDLVMPSTCSFGLCTWTPNLTFKANDRDNQPHPAQHFDVLSTAELTAKCCSRFAGDIQEFSLRLEARHVEVVPLPPSALMLGGAIASLLALARRRLGAAAAA